MNLNSFLPLYNKKINEYLDSPDSLKDEDRIELKKSVRNGKTFHLGKRLTEEQKQKIYSYFDRLIDTKPGAEIISRLLKSSYRIELKNGVKTKDKILSAFAMKKCKKPNKLNVYFDFENRNYTLAGKGKNEFSIRKQKKIIAFGHELIHALHITESTYKKTFSKLLDKRYHNEEEQFTILGIFVDNNEFKFEPICENTLRAAFDKKAEIKDYNHRFLHIGWSVNKMDKWSITNDILAITSAPELLTTLKHKLSDEKIEFNKTYLVYEKNCRPLSLALHLDQKEVINELLNNKKIETNYVDDLGHPIGIALSKNNLDTALKIAKSIKAELDLFQFENKRLLEICINYANKNLLTLEQESDWTDLMENLLDNSNFLRTCSREAQLIIDLSKTTFVRVFFSNRNFGVHPLSDMLLSVQRDYYTIIEKINNQEYVIDYKDLIDAHPISLTLDCFDIKKEDLEVAILIAGNEKCYLKDENQREEILKSIIRHVDDSEEFINEFAKLLITLLKNPEFQKTWKKNAFKEISIFHDTDINHLLKFGIKPLESKLLSEDEIFELVHLLVEISPFTRRN